MECLILFLYCYRNSADFYFLILYPIKLLSLLFINSSTLGFLFCSVSIWFGISRVFYIQDHVSYKHSLTSSFPIWMPFISFSCLAVPARVLKCGSRHPFLVPDVKDCFFYH